MATPPFFLPLLHYRSVMILIEEPTIFLTSPSGGACQPTKGINNNKSENAAVVRRVVILLVCTVNISFKPPRQRHESSRKDVTKKRVPRVRVGV